MDFCLNLVILFHHVLTTVHVCVCVCIWGSLGQGVEDGLSTFKVSRNKLV